MVLYQRLKKTVLAAFLLLGLSFLNLLTLYSQQKISYKGFSGGMYVHSGHLKGRTFQYLNHEGNSVQNSINGWTYGIGGRGAFQIGNHYRCGIEGYATTLTYDKNGSYQRIGWGGILNEAMIEHRRFTSFIGLTVGGGNVNHFIIQKKGQVPLETIPANVHNYSIIILNPFIGTQYKLNNRLSLSIKADYMFSPNASQHSELASGLRLYIGILFIKPNKKK